LYTGRVQGVGFRWSTLRALEGLSVDGYVQNLRDGRVELVMEGEPETLDSGQERIREAMAGYIDDEATTTSAPTGEFQGMGIRR
jgi:acylphosphatase